MIKIGKNLFTYMLIMILVLSSVSLIEKYWISRGEDEAVREFSAWIYTICLIIPAIMIGAGILAGFWKFTWGLAAVAAVLMTVGVLIAIAFVFTPGSLLGRSGQPVFVRFMFLIAGIYIISYGLVSLIMRRKG